MKVMRFLLLTMILLSALWGCSGNTSEPVSTVKPGQSYIFFYSTRDNHPGWYLMNTDGSSIQPFQTSKLTQYQIDGPTWISDLQLFAMGLTDPQHQQDLYLVDINGAIKKRLTNGPDHKGDAVYSAAAAKIAYVCVEQDLDICTVSADGKDKKNLTQSPARDFYPRWTKSGAQIVFDSNRSGVPGIWIINSDGTQMKALSNVTVPESNPEISPDGQWIAFQSQREVKWDIYLMDLNGQNLKNLTQNPGNDTEPKWSPDGKYIAFRSDRDNGSDLYIMKADGSQAVNITQTPEISETNFVWMPDSATILYSAQTDNNLDIFSVSIDGKNRVNLTRSPAVETDPQIIDLK